MHVRVERVAREPRRRPTGDRRHQWQHGGRQGDLFITPDNPTGLDTTRGTATGSIKENHVSFTITPNYGADAQTYEGEIWGDGKVTGWVQYTKPQLNWTSPPGSVTCTTTPTGTGGGTATVTDDVDVYSRSGGDDQFKLGFLTAGTQVNVVGGGSCPAEDWCHVTGLNVPNGDGYAWGAFFK